MFRGVGWIHYGSACPPLGIKRTGEIFLWGAAASIPCFEVKTLGMALMWERGRNGWYASWAIIRRVRFFFFFRKERIFRIFREFLEKFRILYTRDGINFYYCLDRTIQLSYFTPRNIRCWYREFIEGGSSNKNCSFRGEVGSLDEKSSFQDKHGPSLNRAHGWLCRSSLFSFFRGFAGQRSINLFVRANFPDIRTFKIKCFFSIQTVLWVFFSKFFCLIYIYTHTEKQDISIESN